MQVHKYCTKWEAIQFTFQVWNLFTQENESRGVLASLEINVNQVYSGFTTVHGFSTFKRF